MSAVRSFRLLATEAVQDAIRRRVVAAIVAVSILSLLAIDGCTSCTGGTIVINGEPRELPQVAGAAGLLTFSVLALWCIALAGVLSAEHLTQPLDDGSATLALARPVGRGSFAFARLAGALAIAGATGVVLLGATTALLGARSGLPPGPAVAGTIAFAAGAVTVGALAMTVSLWLGRVANVLLVFAGVGAVTLANALSLAGREPGGALGLIDALGPPLASAIVLAVSPWVPDVPLAADPAALVFRSVVWAGLSLVALWLAFGRAEIGRAAP
jgi:ABC-type transport system involved in multi-copper enzyme maturation permease subunit